MKFNAPTAANFLNSSLRSSGTRLRRSSIPRNGWANRSFTIACPDCSLNPFTYLRPRRRERDWGMRIGGEGETGEVGDRGTGGVGDRGTESLLVSVSPFLPVSSMVHNQSDRVSSTGSTFRPWRWASLTSVNG